ncbi:MBL fold metallo-hydrolase [Micromonospora sp. NPDC049366]|uniref:MBL fold metallo-hydrolase n=1 Tax=Micromonospora sp. NPDC049366 TaxID=3364271 RepID=UPI003796FBAA
MEYAVHSVRRPSATRDLPFGPEDLRWVANTATLVYGERDAVLVDTYTTVEQNQALVDWVRSFGRRLTHVYITHGHGDHLFGIGQIVDAFPGVRAVATRETVAGAEVQVGPEWVDSFWEQLFPGQIPQHLPVPETLDGDAIDLEGHRLEAIGTGATDTAGSTVLWVPDLRLLVAGDVAYNDTHQYMAESTAETRAHWAATVDRLRELDPVAVVAGHKNPDRADDPAILAETATYLRDFDEIAARTTTAEELYAAMLERYPRRVNPGSLWGGAKKAKPAS